MPKANQAVSLGVVGVAAIAIIVIIGFGIFLSGSLNTIGTPSSSNSSNSTQGLTTTVTYPGLATTSFATTEASSSSPSGLRLDLFVAPSNGSIGVLDVEVDEYNTLGIVNNVSLANDWQYPQYSLNPYDNCGAPGPVGFAIFQGYYNVQNYSTAKALTLYNSTYAFTCTTTMTGNYLYSFNPNSNLAVLTNSGKTLYNFSTLLSFSTKGYWSGGFNTGSNATFQSFPQGSYTVLAADEWGKIALVHFTVTSAGLSSGTSTFTTESVTTTFTSPGTITTKSSENWDPAEVANLTLNSPQVQGYIKTAYNYDFSMISDPYGPSLVTVLMNITGSQSVIGNWTTGYNVTYSGIIMLNATVQFIAPSTYYLISVGVTNLSNQTRSIAFSSQQKQVIQVALSNNTVQKFMGQSPYYVESVTQFPIQNGTFGGDYFALLYQVDGTRIVGVFVNNAITTVVDAYNDTRITTFCYGSSDTCFTSPWNAAG